jgi:hypothetical protein
MRERIIPGRAAREHPQLHDMPQIGHRIDERALMRTPVRARAHGGDLVLAGHVPDQFRRRGRAPGWPGSGQPWRAFQRGFRLLSTNTRRPRRTTTDPAFCFNARSEFLAFIVRRPFGPSSLLQRIVEVSNYFPAVKIPAWQDPCDQSRRGSTGTVRRAAAWRASRHRWIGQAASMPGRSTYCAPNRYAAERPGTTGSLAWDHRLPGPDQELHQHCAVRRGRLRPSGLVRC